jgi:solute carrier family 25 phosphate transporter 3
MAAIREKKLPLGKIEPNSAKYFWSCAVGGIIGTVKHPAHSVENAITDCSAMM